jgi:Mce-associated membrane protein
VTRRSVPRALRIPARRTPPSPPGPRSAPPTAGPLAAEPPPAEPPAAEPPGPGPRPAAGRRVRAVAAGAAAVVLAGGLAAGVWADRRAAAIAKDSESGLAAAVSAAEVILSYDHRRIEADISRATARTTGRFRGEYEETSRAVAPVAREYQAVVKASVKASAVVRAEPGEVVVLLFVDQATTSTRITGTKSDQSRVRMTMLRTGPGWRVSRVEAL